MENIERTKEIPIVANAEENDSVPSNESSFFSISASTPFESTQVNAQPANNTSGPNITVEKDKTPESAFQLSVAVPASPVKGTDSRNNAFHSSTTPSKKIGIKAWHLLEWLTTSALIFATIFFALNFSSYSELLKFKINELRGISNSNPILEKLLPSAEPITQQLLPVAENAKVSKKQLPPLDLEIAPPDDRIIIPKIGQNIPVVKVSTENLLKRDWGALESDIQEALRDGVVHYPGTAEPGVSGNVVITGHSSYFPWDPGRFKDVFSLLHKVAINDIIVVYHNQKAYTYKVYEKKEVNPNQVDVLVSQGESRLTLITCTPVGTNLRRLIVLAKPM